MTHGEAALMPRCTRRPPAGRALRADDAGRRSDAREVAMLEGQLDALGRDIRSARSALGRPVALAAERRADGV